jgi:hypothetical protein
MLKLFENTYGSTFTHDEAIAVCVEGAATGWWVVVIGRRERTGPSEAGKCERMDAGLGATGDHNVGIPESNEARCIANRVSTRGTGSSGGVVGALEAIPHGNMSGGHVK